MSRPVLHVTCISPAAILLLGVVAHRPHRYFVFLRLVIAIAAAVLVLAAQKQGSTGWMWTMLGILVLFNPLVPFHVSADVWRLIGVAVAAVFIAAAATLRVRQRKAAIQH